MQDANPLYLMCELPRFEDIRPEHVGPAIDALLSNARAMIESIEKVAACDWDSIVAPLDESFDRLQEGWNVVSHLAAVAGSAEWRNAYSASLPKVAAFAAEISQNEHLYERYKALAAAASFPSYSTARQRVVTKMLQTFRLAGMELAPERRERAAAIRIELSALCAQYEQRLADATHTFTLNVDDETSLAGLPQSIKNAARTRAEAERRRGWTLSLQTATVWGVLNHCGNRRLREKIYKAFTTRCSELGPLELSNAEIVEKILSLRGELAAVLGFESFAHCLLVDRMLTDPESVMAFLRELTQRARVSAASQLRDMQEFAKNQMGIDVVQPWDAPFIAERMKESIFGFSAESVRLYFSEHAVLQGLFGILQTVFGLTARPGTAQVWHKEVKHVLLMDSGGEKIGDVYLDLYARPGKRGGAWVAQCRSRKRSGARVRTPAVFLCCNFEPGLDGKEATFTHDDTVTLFHEVGHCLHHVLTTIDEVGVSGITGVEWDAIELPSQLLENFAWEWRSVAGLTAHVETNQPMPEHLFRQLLAARNFHYGLTMMRQIEFALIDMMLHIDTPGRWSDALRIVEAARAEIGLFPAPQYNRFLASFPHIFGGGYAAGYYGYLWSAVISADAFEAFCEVPDQMGVIGRKFRREILAMGGSRSIVSGFREFRGRLPDSAAFLKNRQLA